MDYELLGPLEYEELCVIAVMCYLAIMSLPWLLFWYGEIYTVDTYWKKGRKIGAACGINLAEVFIHCVTILFTRLLRRTRGRNPNPNRP